MFIKIRNLKPKNKLTFQRLHNTKLYLTSQDCSLLLIKGNHILPVAETGRENKHDAYSQIMSPVMILIFII